VRAVGGHNAAGRMWYTESVLFEERDMTKDGSRYGNLKQKHRLRFYQIKKKNYRLAKFYLVPFPEFVECSLSSRTIIQTGCAIFAHF